MMVKTRNTRRPAFGAGLLTVALVGCSGGGGGGGSAPPASTSAPTAEAQQARELAASALVKRGGLSPLPDESLALGQMDQQLTAAAAPFVQPNRYVATFNRLAQRASIGQVQAAVVSDLACTVMPFGGGVSSDRVLVLDGKLMDMFAEVSNALALREAGRLGASLEQMVDAAAGRQLAFGTFCLASDPLAFPDAVLTAEEQARAVEIFTQLTGGIFFHEFGHVWGWHALLKLRDGALWPGGGFFAYTSAIEDNADITSGILAAKSGHDLSRAQLAYDMMAFVYFYRQSPGSVSYAATQSWNAQYARSSPTYSSLATRKQLLGLGAASWGLR